MLKPTKRALIQEFFRHIQNQEWNGLDRVVAQINECLSIKRKYYQKEVFIVFKNRYPYPDYSVNDLLAMKRNLPLSLIETCFFSNEEFWRYYYGRLLEERNYIEIGRTMAGILYWYDPVLYHIYGLYSWAVGKRQRARKNIFLSGIYDDDTEALADAYLKQFEKSHSNQLLGQLPEPFLSTFTRNKIPQALKAKLKQVNVPEWLIK